MFLTVTGLQTMLHRLYSSLVLCYDTVHMVVGIICSIIESTIHIFKPPVAKSVKGEVALVVGAGHGVGRELALQLATLGATVVCWDADHGAGRETAEAAGGEARAYLCDVSDREQILQTARLVQKEVGDVSILIHCGGAPSRCRSLSELTLEDTKAMSDSIFSYFWVLEAFLPRMRAANRGHVAVLSSAAGLAGAGERVALRTAQFAAQGLVESLAEELRVSGLGGVRLTLASVHPRAAAIDDAASARVPHFFGTPDPKEAAHQILMAMRRNYSEVSVPHYLFYLANMFRILPPKASRMLREVLDVGVEAC
ncbi:epidermal retinol dehydrogenase 2-like isoform X2 [Bacillus rossius redtenbacheri]|uniref:epidermal retinol dehydrogenase 2-like isoform X2 n=1 Tax=Bacillus rossius redtenbacheri TaxID=93214 RepID=UPI002FDCC12A